MHHRRIKLSEINDEYSSPRESDYSQESSIELVQEEEKSENHQQTIVPDCLPCEGNIIEDL